MVLKCTLACCNNFQGQLTKLLLVSTFNAKDKKYITFSTTLIQLLIGILRMYNMFPSIPQAK
jgi:hypothetical protein